MSEEEIRKLAAIMFTDMVGYSALSQRDDKLALELLEEHRKLLREIFPRFHGSEIKTIGDAFLVEFNSALEAAQCAIEIQRALAKRNADAPADRQIELKIGIHIGDVVHRGGDVYGDGVNIASRIEPLAGAGGICVSMDVERQIRNAVETRFEKLAPTELKNISVPMELFRIVLPWERQSKAEGGRKKEETSVISAHSTWIWTGAGVAAALLLMGVAGWWWSNRGNHSTPTSRQGASPPRTEAAAGVAIPEKSIAVLPFDNLSDDKANAYFAEGIQDEILTRLSKIAALKVISRTSTQKYKSAPDNLREVGQQLGVANLLEGSVQKAGNAVHINVQLIKAATDEHMWAESYDRELQNIFGVEGEVAGAIADQLNAKLTGSEKESLSTKPTSNPQAYDAYLRGLAFAGRVDAFAANVVKSIAAFEEAARLDPQFGLAWAHLVREDGLAYINFDHTPQRRDAGLLAVQNALKLAPTLPETQLADGMSHNFFQHDTSTAKSRYEAVHQNFPNNSFAVELLGSLARQEGDWTKSQQYYKAAIDLDPQNVFLLADASLTDAGLRDLTFARNHLERARNLSPQNSTVVGILASTHQMSGDFAQAQTLLDGITAPAEGEQWYFNTLTNNAIFLRKYEPAMAMLKAQLRKPTLLGNSLGGFQSNLADLQRHAGDTAAADHSYEQARVALETALSVQPENSDLIASLAWVEMWLGHKDKAFDLARKAVALTPASKNGFTGPQREETLARIEAHFGDKDDAIAAVQHLLTTSYGPPVLTTELLRIDPDWDNLRGDPRFEKLCQEPTK
ncbi:MAG TPA: adenylate/guanylate cyclase domain-containing protein [Chthoniobacterales bacterium]|nr:adenylate/guanylate cyclase domain-containing protein [Chthoniobacterales bacterium]